MPVKKCVDFITPKEEPRPFPFVALWMVVGLVLVAVVLSWGKWGGRMREAPATPQETSEVELGNIVDRVASHILINRDEEPTIATVQDPEALRLKDPVFYKDADVGDRLLIWSDKAVLYSEADDVILSVMPVTFTPPADQATSTNAEMRQGIDSIAIEVRNGTRTPGVGKTMGDELTAKGWEVLKPRDAIVKGYEKTIVAVKNVNASTTKFVQMLANDIDAEIVDNFPSAETGVNGDILVIVGVNNIP